MWIKYTKSDKMVYYPDSRLRTVCTPVTEITEGIKILLRDMENITIKSGGVGLAANQLGETVRVIVVYLQGKFWKLINPEIVWSSTEETLFQEKCLSLPDDVYSVNIVKRPAIVAVQALNKKGKVVQFSKLSGLDASRIQHEIDHLNGILILDKAINNANSLDETGS